MSEIERYEVDGGGCEYASYEGRYVRYSDHEAEIAALKTERDDWHTQAKNFEVIAGKLLTERDALKKELANEKDAHEVCHAHRLALAKDLEIARGERNRAILETRQECEKQGIKFASDEDLTRI